MRGVMRFRVFIAILFLLLFLVGCQSVVKGEDEPAGLLYFDETGSDGIYMEFLADQPPTRLYTGTPLIVVAEVSNRGIYDVVDGSIYLTGYDPRIISGLQTGPERITLDGKSQFNPDGDVDVVEFMSSNIQLPPGTNIYNPNLVLTSCYAYETLANPIVCVDPDPLDILEDKACEVSTVSISGDQGAPIAVSSIEEEATPTELFFRIQISNVGGGQVFSPTKMTLCPNDLQYQDLNKVELTGTLSGKELICKPSNPIRLANGEASVFCKIPQFTEEAAFESPLNLILTYGYKSSISKRVEIIEVGSN